jgi:adenosylcobinamide-phosphate synthase
MSAYRRRVLLTALLLDVVFGEPPNPYHPVAWMGKAIGQLRQRVLVVGKLRPLLGGAGISLGGTAATAVLAFLIDRVLRWVPLGWLLAGVLLKLTFSLRGLSDAACSVEAALRDGDIQQARHMAAWHLVSRDTSQLDEAQVAAAAVESVAENTSDGVIAPLLFYALGGLPAAYAYRWAQTCDSMLGYRDEMREWLGKVPARFDDLLNLIPSRLTALLFVVAAPLVGDDSGRAYRIWRRDGGQTASPNAGQPMSAAAGALGVKLEKVGHYQLGEGLCQPQPDDIRRARYLMFAAVGLFSGLLFLLKDSHAD